MPCQRARFGGTEDEAKEVQPKLFGFTLKLLTAPVLSAGQVTFTSETPWPEVSARRAPQLRIFHGTRDMALRRRRRRCLNRRSRTGLYMIAVCNRSRKLGERAFGKRRL
jgi:hypothetical protein